MTVRVRWAGIDHRFVEANGLRFHVAECGSGDKLALLLHGFPECWYSWRRQSCSRSRGIICCRPSAWTNGAAAAAWSSSTTPTAPNVTLSLVEDDHQLIASLPRIWDDVEPFLGLT